MLGEIGKDQIGRDWRHLVEPGLAKLAFDVVFLGETEAAMGLDAGICRFVRGIGRQHLRHVCFGAAILPGLVEADRLADHQLGRPHVGIGPCDRELDALVLADGAAEHHALLGVGGRLVDEPLGVADAFGGNENPFGIHARENVTEPLALLADEVLGRHPDVVEEHLRGRVIHHGADGPYAEAGGPCCPHVEDEDGQPVGALCHIVLGRGARQEQHQVGMLGPAGPHLLAVDDIGVAVACGEGSDRAGVGSAARFGHAEGLQAQLARGDSGEVRGLLGVVAVPQQRAHDVHLRMTSAAVAAGVLDLLEHRGGGRQGQSGAAIILGDEGCEVSRCRQRADERGGIGLVAVELAPVVAGELVTEPSYGSADLGVILVGRHAATYARRATPRGRVFRSVNRARLRTGRSSARP